MTRISITSAGQSLVRITYEDGVLALETNLSDAASARAISEAMERMGRETVAEDRILALVAKLKGECAWEVARACAALVVQIDEKHGLPESEIDIGELSTPSAN